MKARRNARVWAELSRTLAEDITAVQLENERNWRIPAVRGSRYPVGRGWIRRDTVNAITPNEQRVSRTRRVRTAQP